MIATGVVREVAGYYKFTGKSRLDKAINTLVGLIEGIALDGVINDKELGLLHLWLTEHEEYRTKHPFNDLVPVVEASVQDQVLDEEERKDILWLCERLQSTQYFDAVTADLQVLHAILGGIAADGLVTKEELVGLREWVDNHEHLRTLWPFDEVDSLLTAVLRDGKIDDNEQRVLKAFFSEFLALLDNRTITNPSIALNGGSLGVCAMCPEIVFEVSTFCFTGVSSRYKRADLHMIVGGLGGIVSKTVNASVNYLVIGAEGNPCWAYSCYGRKVEAAIEYRKRGYALMIIHENDFHDAVLDQS